MKHISLNATMTGPLSVKEYPAKIYEQVRQNKFLYFGAVSAAYLLLTVVFTWPLLPNFGSQLVDTEDPLFIAWVVGSEIWSVRTGDLSNFWNQPIFYPYPNTLALSDHSLSLTIQGLPTYLITNNPIATANSLCFIGFFLSALFAYFLIFHYTGSRKAAFLGGAAFSFGAYHMAQISHLQVINCQYIPLALLFFEKLLKTPTWKNALFFTLAFTLNAFVSVYLLGFILVPLAVILVLRFLSREVKFNKKLVFNFLLAGILSAGLVGPWLIPYLEIGRDFNVYHGAIEFYSYSVHPDTFLVAYKTNWLFGWFNTEYRANNPGESWLERQSYLGLLTIGLALWGVASRDKEKKKFHFTATSAIWLTILLACLIFAFGPIIGYNQATGSGTIGPYALLTQVAPIYKGIRVPSRFIIIVTLALAVFIGFAARKLEGFSPRLKLAGYIVFAAILVIENGSFPLQLQTPLPVNTALYEWTTANLPKEAVLIHYPFSNSELNVNYLRGSLLDHHRTVNGYSSFTPESILELEVLGRSNPDAFVKVSATIGVNYLIVHGDYIAPTDLLVAHLKEKGFAPVATFGNDAVYEISAAKETTLYNVVPVNTSNLDSGRLNVDTKNETPTIFVSHGLEKINLKVTFLKGGSKVGENNLSYYKPLFLMPGQVSSASVEISPPLFGFDDISVEFK